MTDENVKGPFRGGSSKPYHFAILKEMSVISDKELEKFSSCRSDLERVAFIYSLPFLRQSRLAAVNTQYRAKSIVQAHDNRLAGNKAFQLGNYPLALALYSKAVIYAPIYQGEGDAELALALANRSAVLFHTESFADALEDIEEALCSGYPEQLQYKLIEREAKCYLAVRNGVKATTALNMALTKIGSSSLDPGKRLRVEADIKRLLKQATELGSVPHSMKLSKSLPPPMAGGGNGIMKTLSRRVEIQENEDCGRYAVAAENIGIGDVLLVQKAYASVMRSETCETNCHHCCRSLKKMVVPCVTCSRILFCSRSCRREAMVHYHAIECCIHDFFLSAGIGLTYRLALRMISIKPLQFFMDLKPVLERLDISPREALTDEMNSYIQTYNLLTHTKLRQVESLFESSLMSVILLKCLKVANYFGNHTSTEGPTLSCEEQWIGSLLLRHIHLIQVNGHEIPELQITGSGRLDSCDSITIGAGIYPTLALLNHSCNPCVTRYFMGNTVIVCSIKTIAQGETIDDNYGPFFTKNNRDQRRKTLKECYWFHCLCRPCVEDWPLYSQIGNQTPIRLKCSNRECGRPLVVREESKSSFVKCLHCKTRNNILQLLDYLKVTTPSKFQEARELVCQDAFSDALQCFSDILSHLEKIVCPPYQDQLRCQEGIRKCLWTMGNVRFHTQVQNH